LEQETNFSGEGCENFRRAQRDGQEGPGEVTGKVKGTRTTQSHPYPSYENLVLGEIGFKKGGSKATAHLLQIEKRATQLNQGCGGQRRVPKTKILIALGGGFGKPTHLFLSQVEDVTSSLKSNPGMATSSQLTSDARDCWVWSTRKRGGRESIENQG